MLSVILTAYVVIQPTACDLEKAVLVKQGIVTQERLDSMSAKEIAYFVGGECATEYINTPMTEEELRNLGPYYP